MAEYLDKEKVLKALTERCEDYEFDKDFPATRGIRAIKARVARGEFNANPGISQWQLEQYNLAHGKALAEKGAEITRLKNQCNDKDHVLQDRWNRIEVNEKRIAQQDQELKDLGEALRKARKPLEDVPLTPEVRERIHEAIVKAQKTEEVEAK